MLPQEVADVLRGQGIFQRQRLLAEVFSMKLRTARPFNENKYCRRSRWGAALVIQAGSELSSPPWTPDRAPLT